MTSLRFLTFTFWYYYVLKLLRLETITFSDATLSDINVVLCYVLSKYRHDIDASIFSFKHIPGYRDTGFYKISFDFLC